MKKPHFRSFRAHLKKELKNPVFRAAYEKEGQKLQVAYAIALLRNRKKLSQKQLAEKLKISQAAVARIESGEQNLTLETLMKIGAVFGKKLKVSFV